MFSQYKFKTTLYNNEAIKNQMTSIQMPYWISGIDEDREMAIVVCDLPTYWSLNDIWTDAHDIEVQAIDAITYSACFPKPDWIKE